MSVDGAFGGEAALFLCHLADKLSVNWCKPYSVVLGWIKVKLNLL